MREKRKKPAEKAVEKPDDKPHAEEPSKKITRWVVQSIREEVRDWPDDVKEEMGGQLNKVEYGGEPDDFKPMQTIGMGVYEIRVTDEGNNKYRLIYVAKFEEAIYVLHVITKKKSQKTPQLDIDTASRRFARLQQWRKEQNL
ncbi:MAG: type II toxin-antitoxin system RelE/ParE family toxin [Candidatus Obscuribacterales bacterium]|nr:type II toxin-antitoxin system RelE/ParE family toxin [Candidatus Obscuribacterales bacterium]